MYIKMVTRLYDDEEKECKIGDSVIIQTKTMNDIAVGVIKNIQTNLITLEFDDPLIGYQPINVRKSDIIKCILYK